jgi:hypothetical protein
LFDFRAPSGGPALLTKADSSRISDASAEAHDLN